MPRPSRSFLVALFAALSAASFSLPAAAVGLGTPELRSHLGEPLRLALPLRIAPGEGFSDDCVRVAPARDGDMPTVYGARARVVRYGDHAEVIVTSGDAISEPVLRIVVEVGCTASVSREVVMLLDPPTNAGTTMPGAAESEPVRPVPPLPPRRAAAPVVARADASSADGAPVAAPRPRPARPTRSPHPATATPAPTVASASSSTPGAAQNAAQAVTPSAPGPRMRLEDPIAAAQSIARAPDAAAAPGAMASPPAVPQPSAQEVELISKLTALGEQIEMLKRQVADQAALNAQLRSDQEHSAPKEAMYALALVAVVALIAVLVMSARLRTARRTVPSHAWWAETRMRGDPATLMRPPAGSSAANEGPPSTTAPTGPTATSSDDVFYPAGSRTDPGVRHVARGIPDARIEVEELGATQAMKVLSETQTTLAITSNFEPAVRAAAAKHAAQEEAIHALDFDLGEPVETAPRDEIPEVDIPLDSPVVPQPGPSEFVPPALKHGDGKPMSRVEARQVQTYLRQTADAIEQADAYLSAGQSESASSVLRRLIQDREGAPRAPWLMLLLIYRRGDKQDAYEGLVQKFAAQFGRMPPPWDLAEKNPVEPGLDSDPELLQAIWAKWGSPDSMSLLSRLLYERDADDVSFFNLTLQRDLLNFVKICPLDDG